MKVEVDFPEHLKLELFANMARMRIEEYRSIIRRKQCWKTLYVILPEHTENHREIMPTG